MFCGLQWRFAYRTYRVLPHRETVSCFQQLDAEVEDVLKTWETVRGVQEMLQMKELQEGAVKDHHLSELLMFQETVKDKIQQSQSILDLTSSFHFAAKQVCGPKQVLLRSLTDDAEL